MTDRPASWRMPTPKQMEKLAAEAAAEAGSRRPEPGRSDAAGILGGRAGGPAERRPRRPNPKQRLSEIQRHVLRVSCRRCGRTVEIQKADAVRLAGAEAVWKDVGQRLLDDTCQQRTGRHEEDGCWPSFDSRRRPAGPLSHVWMSGWRRNIIPRPCPVATARL